MSRVVLNNDHIALRASEIPEETKAKSFRRTIKRFAFTIFFLSRATGQEDVVGFSEREVTLYPQRISFRRLTFFLHTFAPSIQPLRVFFSRTYWDTCADGKLHPAPLLIMCSMNISNIRTNE